MGTGRSGVQAAFDAGGFERFRFRCQYQSRQLSYLRIGRLSMYQARTSSVEHGLSEVLSQMLLGAGQAALLPGPGAVVARVFQLHRDVAGVTEFR